MSEYRRYYIKGGTWFFTVNLRNRRSQLLTTQYQMPDATLARLIVPTNLCRIRQLCADALCDAGTSYHAYKPAPER